MPDIEPNISRISDPDDPRLEPFRQLKDRELVRSGGRFIAEGEHVVKRLIASDFPVESVVLAERRAAELSPVFHHRAPVLVLPDPLIHQLVGFKFHSGVVACGRKKPGLTIESVLAEGGRQTFVICPELANAENLGGLIRISSAFGATAMILGERSCDPFFRQSIRVSMGNVFRLPIVESTNLIRDLETMKRHSVELVATVLDSDAEPLDQFRRGEKLGLLFGNEAQGLDRKQVDACDRKITIPMKLGTDSLNVFVAAGVILYELSVTR